MHYGLTRVATGASIAVIVLVIFVAVVGIEDVAIVIGSAEPLFIVAALIFSLLIESIRGKMWQENLNKVQNKLRYFRCVGAVYSSTFVNSFFTGGQLLTAYLLAKDKQNRPEDNFAAMMAQDILTWISAYLFIVLGVTYYVLHNPSSAIVPFLIAGALLGGVMLAVSWMVVWREESWLEHIAIFTGDVIYKLRTLFKGQSVQWKRRIEEEMAMEVRHFDRAMHLIFNSRLYIAKMFFYSLIVQLSVVLTLYSSLRAIGVVVPLLVVFIATSLSNLFSLIPLPGGIGGVEVGLTTLLIFLFSLSVPVAAAAVLLYRILHYWVPLVLGGIALWILSGGQLFSRQFYIGTETA